MYYCLVQATALLQKNLDNAKASLEVLVADLQFLRDQVTITQVTLIKTQFFFSLNWQLQEFSNIFPNGLSCDASSTGFEE